MRRRAFIATMALAIGAAIVWTIAAGSEDSAPGERATSSSEREAVRLEARLAGRPDDEKLMLRTMHAWLGAGSERFMELDFSTKPIDVPESIADDYRAGLRIWNRYLTQTGGEASRDEAESAGSVFFSLVEIGSRVPGEAEADAAGAARALRIACRHGGNLFNLSNLASYSYFNGEFAAGDRAAREAAADIAEPGGIEPRDVIGQLDEYRERAEKFRARLKRGAEELAESGEEELEAPIKGYGAPAGINGYEPGAAPRPGEVR